MINPLLRPLLTEKSTGLTEKKKHTLKAQIVIKGGTRKILKTDFSNGKKHDFKLFKESNIALGSKTKILADTGYQGIQKLCVSMILSLFY